MHVYKSRAVGGTESFSLHLASDTLLLCTYYMPSLGMGVQIWV